MSDKARPSLRHLVFEVSTECPRCEGLGREGRAWRRCRRCKGTGYVLPT